MYTCIHTLCKYTYICIHAHMDTPSRILIQICTANPTWGDIFDLLFQSSKLKARTSLLPRFSEKSRSSFEPWVLKELWKTSPHVGLAVSKRRCIWMSIHIWVMTSIRLSWHPHLHPYMGISTANPTWGDWLYLRWSQVHIDTLSGTHNVACRHARTYTHTYICAYVYVYIYIYGDMYTYIHINI